MHKKVCKIFEIENLGYYHDIYIQSGTLLLEDFFENFQNKNIERYELDPTHFLSAIGSAWQTLLKKKQK